MAVVSLLPLAPWVAAHILREGVKVHALETTERQLLEEWLAQSSASGPPSPAEWASVSAALKGVSIIRLSTALRAVGGLETLPGPAVREARRQGPLTTAGEVLATWLEGYAPLFLHAPACSGSCRQSCGGWWIE